jgi:hypothetical protein
MKQLNSMCYYIILFNSTTIKEKMMTISSSLQLRRKLWQSTLLYNYLTHTSQDLMVQNFIFNFSKFLINSNYIISFLFFVSIYHCLFFFYALLKFLVGDLSGSYFNCPFYSFSKSNSSRLTFILVLL